MLNGRPGCVTSRPVAVGRVTKNFRAARCSLAATSAIEVTGAIVIPVSRPTARISAFVWPAMYPVTNSLSSPSAANIPASDWKRSSAPTSGRPAMREKSGSWRFVP